METEFSTAIFVSQKGNVRLTAWLCRHQLVKSSKEISPPLSAALVRDMS